MNTFLGWFFDFFSQTLDGFFQIFRGLIFGIAGIFNIPAYIRIFSEHYASFSVVDWILAILSIIVLVAIWVLLGYLIYLLIRKTVEIRKSRVSREEMFEEISDLHRQVNKLMDEKDRILALKISQSGVSTRALAEAITDITAEKKEDEALAESLGDKKTGGQASATDIGEVRFSRLSEVDKKYLYFTPQEYVTGLSLSEVADALRNFACSRMRLYYDVETFRYMLAGMASTKMILLQGISGTGKTSLPYCMGKFFTHDATIASVQPSWRDRTELFGYFNEFTKKYNETEFLRRVYEASYNDDVNLIILDEMNIARVEYYFAEMLSILEMPDHAEWKFDLVTNKWDTDPKNLVDGKLQIPENIWYIGTANNDDSTFAVSDKVYDRALTINLDKKGEPFDAPDTDPMNISYSYLQQKFDEAMQEYPLSQEMLEKIARLDVYIIQKLRIAFGNRIMKQLKEFTPVYVACGGEEIDAVDYVLATKVFRKFESLNLSLVRDELGDLSAYLTKNFGKNNMKQCKSYLERLAKLF